MSHAKGTVWFDVDGVLLDYLGYFIMEYRQKFKPEYRTITPREIVTYDMSYLFPGGQEEFLEAIWESHNRPEAGIMRRTCTPYKLHALKNMGFSVKAITQFEGLGRYQKARIDNLSREFGPVFDEVIFTKRGQCKLDYIADTILAEEPIPYIIEDNPAIFNKSLAYLPGIRVVAIQHPYNRECLAQYDHIPAFTYADYAIDHIIERTL